MNLWICVCRVHACAVCMREVTCPWCVCRRMWLTTLPVSFCVCRRMWPTTLPVSFCVCRRMWPTTLPVSFCVCRRMWPTTLPVSFCVCRRMWPTTLPVSFCVFRTSTLQWSLSKRSSRPYRESGLSLIDSDSTSSWRSVYIVLRIDLVIWENDWGSLFKT